MRWLSLAIFLVAGCASDVSADLCREGFTQAGDGHCYPPPDPWPTPLLDDVLDTMPDCAMDNPNGAIDLQKGCASGACVWMTADEISAARNDLPACVTASWNDKRVYCTWPWGIEGLFVDDDRDLVPDPGSETDRIHVLPPYNGQTVEGVGVAVNTRCYIDALGYPDWVAYNDIGGTFFIQDLVYDGYGITAYDWGSDDESGHPDGRIDNLYLYGAPP